MRTKSQVGGKRKLSYVDSSPERASYTPKVLRVHLNAEESNLMKKMTPEKTMAGVDGDELQDSDSIGVRTCLRCGKSGESLVCTEILCPIALHESCMPCKPSFDEEGKFYCPYCAYKRAVDHAREMKKKLEMVKKALSKFIDSAAIDNGHLEQDGAEMEVDEGIHLNPFLASVCNSVEEVNNSCLGQHQVEMEVDEAINPNPPPTNVCNSLGQDRVEMEVDEAINPNPPPTNVSNSVEEVELNEDVVNKGRSNEAEICKNQQLPNVEHGAESQEDLGERGDSKREGIVVDQCQTELDDCEEEDDIVDDSPPEPEAEQKNAKVLDESLERREDEEQLQPSKPHDPMDSKIDVETNVVDGSGTPLARKTRFKSIARKMGKQYNGGSTPRKSPRKRNPRPENVARKIEKASKSKKSHQEGVKKRADSLPDAKPRKILWTPEEEDMLREGVHKFSSGANKNLPWRKILEFGRHIFHESRTPEMLKDKWRRYCQ